VLTAGAAVVLAAAGVVAAAGAGATGPTGAAHRVVPNIACGDTITTSLVANTDLHCTGSGITIGADDVTLDLGGHTLSGPGVGAVAVRIVGWRNATVRNGTIANFGGTVSPSGACIETFLAGAPVLDRLLLRACTVHFDLSTDAVVSGSTLYSSGLAFLDRSRRPTVVGCRILGTAGGPGVHFGLDSQPATVRDNTFTRSALSFSQSDGAHVEGNTFADTRLFLEVFSAGNAVAGNTFRGAAAGVVLDETITGVSITGNRFIGNRLGVDATDPGWPSGTIAGNTFGRNGAAGILIDATRAPASGQSLEISDNLLVSNGFRSGGLLDRAGRSVDDGIHLAVPVGSAITLAGNRTRHNADRGIEAQPGTVIDGGGNTSAGEPGGCLGVACT
jgi:hypothetical protein